MGRILGRVLISGVLAALVGGCRAGGSESPAADGTPIRPGRTYGGAGVDQAWSVLATPDGGFAFAGLTNSSGAGGYDAWVVKTNASGQVVQERTYGGAGNDFAFGLEATPDGGFILVGVDGEVMGRIPSNGTWLPKDASGELTLRKLNADLSLAWETKVGALSSGGSAYPYAMGYAVQPTGDGGYIATGATGTGGGGGQTLLVKTDAGGTVLWHAFLAGGEFGTGVRQTPDGGYVVASGDTGLIGTSSSGLEVWNRIVNGTARALCACADGSFAVTGEAPGNAGDVYLAKVSSAGTLLWERTFGTPSGDLGQAIHQLPDGGFILAGVGGTAPMHGFDLSLIRVDGAGATIWVRYFGGTEDEVGRSVRRTGDGGYIVAGSTTSKGSGGTDAYLVRTDAAGTPLW